MPQLLTVKTWRDYVTSLILTLMFSTGKWEHNLLQKVNVGINQHNLEVHVICWCSLLLYLSMIWERWPQTLEELIFSGSTFPNFPLP